MLISEFGLCSDFITGGPGGGTTIELDSTGVYGIYDPMTFAMTNH